MKHLSITLWLLSVLVLLGGCSGAVQLQDFGEGRERLQVQRLPVQVRHRPLQAQRRPARPQHRPH